MQSLDETAQILRLIATIDNRNVTEETIVAWHELLYHASFDDVRAATVEHLRNSTEYLTPAILLGRVRQTRFERYGYNPPAPVGQRWAIDAIESGESHDDQR